jgi:starch synthase
MNIWFLAAEADPFVKVGGLGDVAGSLPPVLRRLAGPTGAPREIDIRLVLPLHGGIDREAYSLKPVAAMEIYHARGPLLAEAYHTEIDGLPVYLISGPMIPEQGPVYTGDAGIDGPKFVFFSLAALELARSLDWKPDVLHANDWHTAAAVYSLASKRGLDEFYQDTAILLEIHNLPYLGAGSGSALQAFGLPPAAGTALPEWAQNMPLPLGLLGADHIVTVSPGYAGEILTPEFGSGLNEFLAGRAASISGILNGLDLERWDPARDPHLAVNFSRDYLRSRVENKVALQTELGLPLRKDLPLLGMITRMDYQKGVDLALEALAGLDDMDWQAVILGTGDPDLEKAAEQLAAASGQVRAVLKFDPGLARRIYGGADALLIPSRYEPCGLAQMIAMRYGNVPIARATGGLKDTILDYDEAPGGTGFLFSEANAAALEATLRRALHVFGDKRRWRGLQRRGMQQDFSWERSAQQYLALYESMLKAHRTQG